MSSDLGAAAPPAAAPRAELLVVDDDESVLLTLQAILQMDGYSVEACSSGSEAIRALRKRTFDLVLTDLRLDDMDGVAILAEIRRRSPDTVAIMLTGYASLETAVKALREGAYDYLVKPCDVEELKATVARGVERRLLTVQLHRRMRELQEANATIRELNRDLRRRVEESTAELTQRLADLERANAEIAALHEASEAHVEQLEELDRLKSQFLSMASHELKTPLTVISGFLQVSLRRKQRRLARGYPGPDEWQDEQTNDIEQLEVLNAQSAKLAKLVDELLDVSRIESGRLEFHFGEVNLRRLTEEVVGRLQLTTTKHELRLVGAPSMDGAGSRRAGRTNGALPSSTDGAAQGAGNAASPSGPGGPGGFGGPGSAGTPEEDATIVADRDHLEQVLNNLLGNAIKYSPDGGAIDVDVHPAADEVTLSVRDRGIGIPASEREAVFSLFYRSRAEGTRQSVSGMGLGLYISKEIVQRHGGRIWVDSEPGKGSTFYVALPRRPMVPEESGPQRALAGSR